SRLFSASQAQADDRDPALDDQEVSRHLTEPPVVVRPPGELRIRRPGDPGEEPLPLLGGPPGQQADRLPEPLGPVRRVIDDPKSHRRIMRSCAFVQNAARTNQAKGRTTGGIRGWD